MLFYGGFLFFRFRQGFCKNSAVNFSGILSILSLAMPFINKAKACVLMALKETARFTFCGYRVSLESNISCANPVNTDSKPDK